MEIYILVTFAFAVLGAVVGNQIHKKYKARRLYFQQLLSLINLLISDFSFRQSKLKSVIIDFEKTAGVEMKIHCNEFINSINGDKLSLSKLLLTSEEHLTVEKFFTALGTLDLDTQLGQLNAYKDKFNEYYQTSKAGEEKYGKPSVKLGFLLGLGCGILIL